MNRSSPSFWQRPRGRVVLGVGGVLLLATSWLAWSRLGSSPASQAFTPAHRIDENALVAANAERPGEAGRAPAAASADNAVEAASGDDVAAVTAAPAGGDKPQGERSDTDRALDDAEAAIDRAADQIDDAIETDEGGKPEG